MTVTLQVLGAAIAVPADLHRQLDRLPTTDRPADAEVRADDPAHAAIGPWSHGPIERAARSRRRIPGARMRVLCDLGLMKARSGAW